MSFSCHEFSVYNRNISWESVKVRERFIFWRFLITKGFRRIQFLWQKPLTNASSWNLQTLKLNSMKNLPYNLGLMLPYTIKGTVVVVCPHLFIALFIFGQALSTRSLETYKQELLWNYTLWKALFGNMLLPQSCRHTRHTGQENSIGSNLIITTLFVIYYKYLWYRGYNMLFDATASVHMYYHAA